MTSEIAPQGDLRAKRARVDNAEWLVTLGWSTGVLLTILRAIFAALFLFGDAPLGVGANLLVIAEVLLCAAFTYGVYRRQFYVAIAFFVYWLLSWAISWIGSQRILPPLGVIGLLVGAGLFQGVRGLSTLRRIEAEAATDGGLKVPPV